MHRSKSTAPAKARRKRSSLVHPAVLAAASLFVTAVFAALYPGEERLKLLAGATKADFLSITYMRVLTDLSSDDPGIRRALVRELAGTGQLAEARSIFEPMLALPGEDGRQARVTAVDLDYRTAIALPDGESQRTEILAALGRQLASLSEEPLDPSICAQLAEVSLAISRGDLAASFYRRASSTSGEITSQKKYGLLALASLLGNGAGKEALTWMDSLVARFGTDADILRRGIEVALSQSDLDLARKWERQLVELTPEDSVALAAGLGIELAASDLPNAVALAQRLVALDPDDSGKREQLVRIARWAQQPALALEHLVVMGRRAPDGEAMTDALRLADARREDGLWMELAEETSKARALAAQELSTLAAIHGRHGKPEQVLAFLQGYLQRRPDQRAGWQALAQIQEQQGDLKAAAATWGRMAPRLVSPVEAARRQGELLLRASAPEEALSALRAVKSQAGPKDDGYWLAYGDVAWARRQTKEAFVAYRSAWDGGARSALAAERLIQLYRTEGKAQLAIDTARQAYQGLAEPRWLLLGMDTAVQAGRWKELEQLGELARADERQFADSEMYWLLRAHIANHAKRHGEARGAYARALELNPRSLPARVGTLWLEIDSADTQRLAEHMQLWSKDAAAEPAFWAPYAVGMMRIGRVGESLPWFARQAQAKPGDTLWRLTYADALLKAGRQEQAWRLRRHVLAQLRGELRSGAAKAAPADQAALLTYASLARDVDGSRAERGLLQALLARRADDVRVREMIVSSNLSQEQFEMARHWLLRSQAEGKELPAWQSLAVALAHDDRPAIDRILAQRGEELTSADRANALRRVDRNDEALALADASAPDGEAYRNTVRNRQKAEAIAARQLRRHDSSEAGESGEQ